MNRISIAKSILVSSTFALLAGAPLVASAGPDEDDSITAVSDADDLDEMFGANNVDTGTQGDGAVESNMQDGSAMDDSSDMEDGTTEVSQDQQDATEATQEQDDASTPPG